LVFVSLVTNYKLASLCGYNEFSNLGVICECCLKYLPVGCV
jgi:hypothetical protein